MRRRGAILILVCAAVSGCSATGGLETTTESARAAVLAVRPSADLGGVKVEIWTPSTDLVSLAGGEPGGISLPELAGIFEAQAPVLTRLALLDKSDVVEFREQFLGLGTAGTVGLAFPARGLILVTPQGASSVEVIAHEFGHIASARMGYGAGSRERLFLRGGRGPDPAWADIDTLIASWLANEADAEFTGRAAAAFLEGKERGLEDLWRRPVPPEEPDLVGPATITRPDGSTITFGAGEGYFFPKSILDTWIKMAYGGSLRLVIARHADGEGLEEALHRTWERFSFSTREVLFPETAGVSSRFAAACRGLGTEVSGATRVGALLVRDMLERRAGLSRASAMDLVRRLEDDIVLRAGKDGLLWVTRWSEAESARTFADLYATVRKGAAPRVDGNLAVATVGDVANGEALLARLR